MRPELPAMINSIEMLPDSDFLMVRSLVEFLVSHSISSVSEVGGLPTDEEIWWGEVTGDNAARHTMAAPLWDELAGLQSEPSKNARRIAQIKKRLREVGEI